MAVDLDAVLRRRKPEKRRAQLSLRPASARISATAVPIRSLVLVPDTCVYIGAAAGRLPPAAKALLAAAVQYHSAVCLGEIAVGIGNMAPTAPGYANVCAYYSKLMSAIPPGRVLLPDETDWLDAGILAGILSRTQNFQPYQRKEVLNDALIYVSAAKAGIPVLTANVDFDLLHQLHSFGAVIFY